MVRDRMSAEVKFFDVFFDMSRRGWATIAVSYAIWC